MADLTGMLQAAAGNAGGGEEFFTWDVSTAVYNGPTQAFYNFSGQESSGRGATFKPDGTKMYITGASGDDVNEYNLSTPWDVYTASFVQVSPRMTQNSLPISIVFKSDGTKMFMVGQNTPFVVNEYSLSTAWDVSTLSFTQASATISGAKASFFKPDGLRMYVQRSSNEIDEYALSSAWDVSSISLTRTLNIGAQLTVGWGLFFKSDGTEMYVLQFNTGLLPVEIDQWTLSTAWNISTASYKQSFSVNNVVSAPYGFWFKDDGTEFYVVGATIIYKFNVATAWDISTATFVALTPPITNVFDVSAQEDGTTGLYLREDGLKMYVIGVSGDDVNEYTLSSAGDITTASFVQSFSVSAQETAPSGVFFKPDGTKMYVLGTSSDSVNEYNLSVAWDVSSASYVQNFLVSVDTTPQDLYFSDDGTNMFVVGSATNSVYKFILSSAWDVSTASLAGPITGWLSFGAGATTPYGVFFKSDGTKFYVVNQTDDTIREYALSTAWDIQSASFTQSVSTRPSNTRPQGLFFKPDGLKMYVTDVSSIAIDEYTLSSAWDISTTSYTTTVDVFTPTSQTPTGVFLRSDGLKMYMSGSGGADGIYEFTLSSAWNISTASYTQSFAVDTQDGTPQDVFFKSDGTKMYMLGAATRTVYEYNLSTAWNVSTASFVQSLLVRNLANSPTGLYFKSDGIEMTITDNSSDSAYTYILGTPWDISTASEPVITGRYSVILNAVSPTGLFFNPSGKQMLVNNAVSVAQYDLATPWSLPTASYTTNFSTTTQISTAGAISFEPNGTKMYVLSTAVLDAVYSYDLTSTPA